MQFDHYANRAAEHAAMLVNLVGEGDLRAGAVQDGLARYGTSFRVVNDDLDDLRSLADDLRGVFAAAGVAPAIETLNRLLTATAITPRVSTHGDQGPHLHVEPEGAAVAVRLRANCLMGLAAVLCDGGNQRLGVCDGSGCERVYVDTSRNARRRFCTDRCATRTHVAAHRARRRAS